MLDSASRQTSKQVDSSIYQPHCTTTTMHRPTFLLTTSAALRCRMALLLWLCWALTPCALAQGLAAETQSQFARPTPRQVLVLY